MLSLRADGQWANEPLISNEQFGAGGVASVRGYQEGQVFGDTGCGMFLAEQKDAPTHHGAGPTGRIHSLIRGSVYMDYA